MSLIDTGLHLRNVTRLKDTDQILRWIQVEAGSGSTVVAVDAPLVIQNHTGYGPLNAG